MVDEADRRSTLERLLGVFTEVKAGEGGTALLLTFNIFLLLTAYYVIKPVRDGLIVAMKSGAEYKSYMSAAIAVALTAAVPAYAAYAKRVPRNRLVVGVTLFFVTHLVVFYGLTWVEAVATNLGLVFYLWVGIFNMMVVAQFWAFANDIYTTEQGERLFALIGIGASTGAVAGSAIVTIFEKFHLVVAEALASLGLDLLDAGGSGRQGDYAVVAPLMLLSAGILCLCALLTQVVHKRETKRDVPPPRKKIKSQLKNTEVFGVDAEEPEVKSQLKSTAVASDGAPVADEDSGEIEPVEAKEVTSPDEAEGSFAMVFRHRYLMLLAAFSLLFTLINSNGEYILGSVAGDAARRAFEDSGAAAGLSGEALEKAAQAWKSKWLSGFYGEFYLYVNILGVVLQSFVVSRVVKRIGARGALFVFPAIALLGASAISIVPILIAVRVAKTFENATDYSFNNTVRNMLWLPTTREMKYKAKQAVDTFFVRAGDVISAVLVFVLAGQMALGVRPFAIANVVLCVVLVLLCIRLIQGHRELTQKRERGELTDDA